MKEDDRISEVRQLLFDYVKSPSLRHNGRTYRLSSTKDKMFHLYRVNSISDDEVGALIGKYRRRGDATKVVADMAYKPEPRW